MGKLNYLLASFILFFLGYMVQAQDVSTAERQALIDLYNATNGANWTNNTNWNTSALVTNWHGVTVVNDVVTELDLSSNLLSGSLPQNIDDLSGLININFDENQLSGAIPTTIGQLTNLEKLTLSRNQLSGSLPTELSQLTNLDLLALWDNNFTGTIPSSLSLLINLERLFLFSNQLSGTIPSSLGQLTSLLQLDLSNNQLTGSIPVELTQLSNLFLLSLFNNQLSGAIPIGLSQLNGLTLLLLGDNSLTGNVPDFTNNSLIRLEIQGNDFVFSHVESEHATYVSNFTTYAFSPQAKVDQEETLAVAENSSITLTSTALTSANNSYQWYKDSVAIAGATSKDYVISNATATDAGVYYFEATNSVVTGLTLTRNDITLSVTAPTCGVSAAEKQALLDLYNSTNGANWTNTWDIVNDEPCDWYGVTVVNGNVTEVNLQSNQLFGNLPLTMGDLVNLTILRLGVNQLSGNIPSTFGNLINLQLLELNENQLDGNIPITFGNLINLQELNLVRNQISGNIPSELGDLANLTELSLAINQLTGSIPSSLGNLSNLQQITLDSNQLSGTIPASLGNLLNLTGLGMSSNLLTGEIPTELLSLVNLLKLGFDNNQLSGIIPDFTALPITSITFAENQFYFNDFESEHTAYASLGDGKSYSFSPQAKVDQEETLAVAENGSITLTSTALTSTNNSYQWYKDGVAIAGATSKDYVISNATATDAGVYYFEATNSVVTGLTLTRNDITLSITAPTCGVSAAEKQALLDLYNSTNGANWTNTWDIVNDEPCDWFGVIVFNDKVTGLSLQGNNLVGSIPSTIDNLNNLVGVALNVNQLAGSIPTQIGNLLLLQDLDLANNQLTGIIPSQLGNLTALTRIAFFQNQLSGSIPSTLGNLVLLEELDLASNQLSGVLPAELGNLNNLVEIYFSNNQLSGPIPPQLGDPSLTDVGYYFDNNQFSGTLPDFTGMSPQQLIIENNSYVFSDFESEHPTYANGSTQYTYIPQAKVDQEETLSVVENGSITLTSSALTSSNNSYQWYKDGVAIAGATSKDYVISNATATDAGVYYFVATNSVVTGLTLTRNDITLNIGADPCGVSATEKQALLDLYNSTNGENWTNTVANNQPWDTNIPVCDWFGVTVVNGNVTVLNIGNNNLSGPIPASIGDLTDLTRLWLFSNQLTGSLPSSIGNLVNIGNMALNDNQLTGNLPPEIGSMTNLQTLTLSLNQFTGNIPAAFGQLTNLNTASLSDNNFSGSIPVEMGNLTTVSTLSLNENLLTGNIPPELANMTNLANLTLSNNQLTGSIPIELLNLPNLVDLRVNNNQLSGTIPDFTTTATPLSTLLIPINNFIFSDFESQHSDYVTGFSQYTFSPQAKVDVEETLFVTEGGNITLTSTTLTSANNSYQWYKDGVAIVGATSKDFVISNATAADAGVYHFTATNSVVTGLTLTRNDITLSVTADTCGVSAAEKQALLDLYNSTNGANWTNTLAANQPWDTNIPVCDWFGVNVLAGGIITTVNLSDNNLSGTIPGTIGQLTSLVFFNLDGNQLTGGIPSEIGQLSNLSNLNLSRNSLTGTIPVELGQLTTLDNLSLGINNLSGSIPSELSQMSSLRIISLIDNNLTGNIPSELGLLSSLETINLNDNGLSGSIPLGLSQLPNLRQLYLRSNQFSGDIPNNFVNLTSLVALNTEGNNFVFSNFENEHVSYITNLGFYDFSPQAKVDQEEILTVQEFSNITLTSTVLTSTNNSYQWFKDGVAIAGATSKDYVISNASATDAGVYYFEATNSVVTGLTLTRNDITLNVEPGSNTIVQQQFCATGGVPTVADLSIPTPAGVTAIWYPTQTGGTPLDQNETLQNDNTYWRDYMGNTEGRAGVEVNIDNLIPIGNPIQEFDAPTNPTLADIVVSLNPSSMASQVQWYASATSTTALANTTALQDGVSYFAAENATTCRLEIRVFLAILDVCTEVVYDTPQEPNALYGNFEGAANVIIANSRNESMGASGWTITSGTPDTFSTPYSNTTDPYLQSSFTASPNGDICAGGLRFQNTAEAFGADIFGLNASTTYVVEFYVANVTNVVNDAISNEAQGFWEITFAGTTKSTTAMAPSTSVATTWKRERLEFDTNSSATQFMEFKVGSNATNQNNAYPVYMLIDGIRVYEKPQSTSSNPCALIEPQVFCNSDDDNQPTIGDLTSPSGNSVTWHSAPIDGTRYFESVELGSINETFVWADEGNGEARVPVEILLDFGAPFGDTYQSFDGNNSPTLADLVVEGTNITWHSSYASIDVLPTSTPLTNDVIYYAAQDGNPCRLSVQVFVGIPTLVGDGNQEFCSSTNPTVGNLVMETTDPSYTLTWYDAETGGLAYNSTDNLVDGQTYYASQGNGADSSEERYPVRVSVIDTAEENKLYERDIQVASGTTIADITTFFELEPTILWYDFPQAGTAYPNTYTLIDGETYYARISEGLCDALEVLAVTVAIEDVTNPELVSCIKFIPQPGDRYVISGWVREHAATPVPANTLEFTEKESFIALLDHLTSKIFAQEDIPPVYELYKDPQAPNVNPLLPFIRNFTGTNVTVYDFQFETELIGLQEVAVGYSFALSPDNLYRFVYRTPLVAYQFNSPLPGGFNVVIFEDYHYPILNYVNLQIEYTDVAIVGNSFRITSNFNLSGATDSPYKTNFTGHTTDSDTDSGIEANVQLFDYVEEPQHMAMDYLNTSITLEYLDENGQAIILPNSNVLFQPKGAIIDGWQRISGDFTIPTNAANMKIYLKNDGSGLNAYFDDVRMHPFDSNLKSFVYDPVTQRLQAELDENNYATFYEYDSEGGLVRVKKETERGVYTIQETRSGNSKLNNGSE